MEYYWCEVDLLRERRRTKWKEPLPAYLAWSNYKTPRRQQQPAINTISPPSIHPSIVSSYHKSHTHQEHLAASSSPSRPFLALSGSVCFCFCSCMRRAMERRPRDLVAVLALSCLLLLLPLLVSSVPMSSKLSLMGSCFLILLPRVLDLCA